MNARYLTLAAAYRQHFGRRAKKIPLDAGSACPNRDGSLSRGGCCFCNAVGSGTGLYHKGFGLRAQWDRLTPPARARGEALVAYLQSFSNTYGPPARLAGLLAELAALPGVAGICLGTRPDCLGAEKIALLAAAPVGYVQLDLGLQSACDATLARIHRGHDAACFARAARAATAAGIRVTAHLMAGLPGEGVEDFLASVAYVSALPVTGVKFHNTLVVAGAPLAALFHAGAYVPMAREDYIAAVCQGIARLRPDIAVERVNADPAPGELVAPAWAADKQGLLRDIRARLEAADIRQGCRLRCGTDT
ncbi:TIGR01212 family radical SAM protein [Solidesulfovibrio sp.]|uniref:TIGR01212 family radical SAM protein n=1 Tax=Solidesulfovibrio sp. TaxID=2910990 RepID=UPI002B20205C|nr:TIGR01212 family radical SAM protein [Solidesulfovibrio sp.]